MFPGQFFRTFALTISPGYSSLGFHPLLDISPDNSLKISPSNLCQLSITGQGLRAACYFDVL